MSSNVPSGDVSIISILKMGGFYLWFMYLHDKGTDIRVSVPWSYVLCACACTHASKVLMFKSTNH